MWVENLQKPTLRGAYRPQAIPSQKPTQPMLGNIKYADQANKGFPAEVELPGVSFASSCVDEYSPGEPVPGGSSRFLDTVWSPDTVVPVVDNGHAPGGAEVLTWWYETGTGYAKDTCGTLLKTVAACSNHPGSHKPLLIPDSCGRASCPV